jgi:hypothetical protein
MMTIQYSPDYHAGFFDAADGEPLFEQECTTAYAAGWRAWHECKDILDSILGTPAEAKLPACPIFADSDLIRPGVPT